MMIVMIIVLVMTIVVIMLLVKIILMMMVRMSVIMLVIIVMVMMVMIMIRVCDGGSGNGGADGNHIGVCGSDVKDESGYDVISVDIFFSTTVTKGLLQKSLSFRQVEFCAPDVAVAMEFFFPGSLDQPGSTVTCVM